MESKHTPGPWEVFPKESKTKVYCDDALGSLIADCTSIYTPLPMEQREANALLISAAPDMFEVIKEIYECSMNTGHKGLLFPKVEAAYLKATGK